MVLFLSAAMPLDIQPPTFLGSLDRTHCSNIKAILGHYFGNSTGVAIFVGGPWSAQFCCGNQGKAMDLNPEYDRLKEAHICDALVLTSDQMPAFLTFLKTYHGHGRTYARKTSWLIKHGMSTYAQVKFHMHYLAISLESSTAGECLENAQGFFPMNEEPLPPYPPRYCVMNIEKFTALTDALTVCLLSMPSGLCNRLGAQYLNILTEEQFKALWKHFQYTHKLLVQGPAGSGKTVIAAGVIDRLNRSFTKDEILYVTAHVPSAKKME